MATNTTSEQRTQPKRAGRPWYRRDPWIDRLPRPLARLERDFESLMDRYFATDDGRAPPWPGFVPAASLFETDEQYQVTLELPGVKPDGVHLELRNGDLWISGEKPEPKEEKGKLIHRAEGCYGEFRRAIPMPGDVEREKIEASCKDGLLTVVLPKSAKSRPKLIAVKT